MKKNKFNSSSKRRGSKGVKMNELESLIEGLAKEAKKVLKNKKALGGGIGALAGYTLGKRSDNKILYAALGGVAGYLLAEKAKENEDEETDEEEE